MNKNLFEVLVEWPKPYISGVDLRLILDKSTDSRHAIVKRAIQTGDLTPIRRDLYLIKHFKPLLVNAFEIAPIVYGPSYVSFESALSFHGWIPEAVRSITSASVKRNKTFETPLGFFSYEHIPIRVFSLGVGQHRQANSTLFIASPLKALADMIYARKRAWSCEEDLFEDLRVEPENFKALDKRLFDDLIENYPSQRVKKTLAGLKGGL